METGKPGVMKKEKTIKLLLVSLALIFIGVTLNHISSTSHSVTGMVQTARAGGYLRDLRYLVIGFFIIAVLCLFLVYIAKLQKNKKI